MKSLFLLFALLAIFALAGCNSQKKSKEVASYKYDEKKVEMSTEFRKLVPEWVKVGKICYGLVVQVDGNGKEIKGKPVKAKVVQIKRDAIIMKALERVSLVEVESCKKMGLSRGDTWEEKDGDLFLTKQDAINALKAKKIFMNDDKVTVN